MNQDAGLRAKGSGFFGFYFDGLPIIKNIDLPDKSEALKAAMQVFIILFIPVHPNTVGTAIDNYCQVPIFSRRGGYGSYGGEAFRGVPDNGLHQLGCGRQGVPSRPG
jgi:hypothetical protein